MNIKEIRQLVKLMVDNDLTELDLVSGEEKVTLKRGLGNVPVVQTLPVSAVQAPAAAPAAEPAAAAAEEPAEELLEIHSPMVGTFYTAASPDSESYVEVDSPVAEDTVVCIIEAMKVMNEIKAEHAGTITEICVKNAQPVEFGQVLFRVRPA